MDKKKLKRMSEHVRTVARQLSNKAVMAGAMGLLTMMFELDQIMKWPKRRHTRKRQEKSAQKVNLIIEGFSEPEDKATAVWLEHFRHDREWIKDPDRPESKNNYFAVEALYQVLINPALYRAHKPVISAIFKLEEAFEASQSAVGDAVRALSHTALYFHVEPKSIPNPKHWQGCTSQDVLDWLDQIIVECVPLRVNAAVECMAKRREKQGPQPEGEPDHTMMVFDALTAIANCAGGGSDDAIKAQKKMKRLEDILKELSADSVEWLYEKRAHREVYWLGEWFLAQLESKLLERQMPTESGSRTSPKGLNRL